ncbi:polysaccharide biosynthesis/export family protein [Novosphingobium sp.]|uniref:polysaccharide biosynthesis/export family protein n=1 Tax=Novosphingobium sp. TaxID=1874826 RepID=UPI003D15312D
MGNSGVGRAVSVRPAGIKHAGTGAGLALAALLSGCASSAFMGRDGPTSGHITGATVPGPGQAALLIVVTDPVARRINTAMKPAGFATTFGQGVPYGALIGPGDTLQIAVFEAPPALLFGPGIEGASNGLASPSQRGTSLPDLIVNAAGQVDVPFAGRIDALGRAPQQVAAQIVARLRGKAHDPQVVVNIAKGASSAVTVVGDVTNSVRMPLTFKGERLLDALAAAGGSRDPVDKVNLELTRDGRHTGLPLDDLIAMPDQNIFLRPGDVVTLSYQPASFTVLGATGRNDEVKFEARGITLAQALGRMGGLRDDRANPHGVFIFRLEDPAALDGVSGVAPNADGKVPVIYRVDLRDPVAFFAAQHFGMRDHDVVYVTNAPITDIQKFVTIIGAAIYPVIAVKAAN